MMSQQYKNKLTVLIRHEIKTIVLLGSGHMCFSFQHWGGGGR